MVVLAARVEWMAGAAGAVVGARELRAGQVELVGHASEVEANTAPWAALAHRASFLSERPLHQWCAELNLGKVSLNGIVLACSQR